METPARKNSLTIALLIIVVIMGAEIGYLTVQNRQLRTALVETASFQVLQQGQTVPALSATDLDGATVAVRYGNGEPSTLLIWFSPSCHLCAENAAFWNALYERTRTSAGVRLLAMSDADSQETSAYVAEHGLRFPIVCATDPTLIEAYNGKVMPQTALISPQGAIEQVWPGALEQARQDEITAAVDSLST